MKFFSRFFKVQELNSLEERAVALAILAGIITFVWLVAEVANIF